MYRECAECTENVHRMYIECAENVQIMYRECIENVQSVHINFRIIEGKNPKITQKSLKKYTVYFSKTVKSTTHLLVYFLACSSKKSTLTPLSGVNPTPVLKASKQERITKSPK